MDFGSPPRARRAAVAVLTTIGAAVVLIPAWCRRRTRGGIEAPSGSGGGGGIAAPVRGPKLTQSSGRLMRLAAGASTLAVGACT
eukprot:5370274-Prymnesium_polylepis.1